MRQEVQTIDEGAHMAAGVSYWLTRDYRLNEEHPPLVKLIAALPVVLAKPHISFNTQAWKESNQWQFARDFLYNNGNDADKLLFLGRLPMVGLTLLLGFFIFLWAKKLAGRLAGLLALAWFAFDPNFLAHGRYITTDVPVTLGFAASLYFLLKLLEKWNLRHGIYFAMAFGLTQVTKFSAVILWLLIILITAIWFAKRQNPAKTVTKKVLRVLGLAFMGTVASILIVYAGQIKSGKSDPWITALYQEREQIVNQDAIPSESLVQKLISVSDKKTKVGKAVNYMTRDLPVPGWSYFKGLALVVNHDYWGHLSYLNGQYSNFGWWYYFPEAFLIKTPLASLILIVIAFIAMAVSLKNFRSEKARPGLWILLFSSAVYFLWSLTSHINLGLRHIYPIYPALFVLIGIFLASVLMYGHKVLKIIAVVFLGLYLTTSILAYPTYTYYFSEMVGGYKNGPKYLVDSNIDWGQDAKRLKKFMLKNNIPFVCMSYFGQASLEYYQIDFRYLPAKDDPHEPKNINCVVAISVTSYLSEDRAYWWLKKYMPDEIIGGSINVYDFRNGRSPKLR